ncbi:GAF domain-containing protein [Oricola sp.]|uniref:GAF domain-containing protein n=1 Tax=Oricola sp. TaxID=1979950 RepID=UPI003BAB8AE1
MNSPSRTRAEELLAGVDATSDRYAAVDAALAEVVGHKLFTLMVIDWSANVAARVYSNRPEEYPVKGSKPLGALNGWSKHVLEGRRHWIGRNADDIRWAFFDHETIIALDCASCLNVPVIDNGRVIGTVNLLHEAGWYNEGDVARVTPFAELLLPAFREFSGATA